MNTRTLVQILLLTVVLLGNLCTPTSALKVVFYNPQPTVRKSQLLASQKLAKPCPQGKMRDHRNRCRRAIIFSRNSRK